MIKILVALLTSFQTSSVEKGYINLHLIQNFQDFWFHKNFFDPPNTFVNLELVLSTWVIDGN